MSDTEAPENPMSNTEAPAKKKHTNPYAPFEKEIAEKVVGPKIREVFEYAKESNESVTSIADLAKRFQALHGIEVPESSLKRWCAAIGISFTRQVTVTGV